VYIASLTDRRFNLLMCTLSHFNIHSVCPRRTATLRVCVCVCVCDDKIANLNRFKQNLQETNTLTVRNFVRKLKIYDVLIVVFLVLQITMSNVVSEKRKFHDYDYLHRFLMRFRPSYVPWSYLEN